MRRTLRGFLALYVLTTTAVCAAIIIALNPDDFRGLDDE